MIALRAALLSVAGTPRGQCVFAALPAARRRRGPVTAATPALATWSLALTLILVLCPTLARAAEPVARVEVAEGGALRHLSWDTEGGDRSKTNLLRQPATGVQIAPNTLPGAVRGAVVALRLTAATARLPFDPRVTPTCMLPASWNDDGSFPLPAVVNAPDFGPMLLRQTGGAPVSCTNEGSRAEKIDDLVLRGEPGVVVELSPLVLPPPDGLSDKALWPLARRGWLNALQPTARWGEQGRPFSAPPGVLGNNVISDPASVSVWFYADQCFWLPEPTPGISVLPTLRRTLDYWLDQKLLPGGEVIGYWDYANFLDGSPSLLIAAWDYVEAGNDLGWLKAKIDRLESVANFLLSRDVDHDGLIEARQSGNANSLQQPARSCAWWDALNCGHKDGYSNALAYRALCCAADFETKLGRTAQAERFASQAKRLRSAYFPTLFNPATGLLAWWKSADGALHDYASPTTCGLAIGYGLVPPGKARPMIDRLWARIADAHFDRLDLGVPPMLTPVRRSDYLQPDAIGLPRREDGADTFGQYMNGGITAGQVLHFIDAHYQVGDGDRGDRVLKAMLERQQRGAFQNGVTDAAMKGIDWTTWDGRPSGYEGYLADSFRFLQAVLLRDPACRRRLYRPMMDLPQ